MNQPSYKSVFAGSLDESKREEYQIFKEKSIQFQVQLYLKNSQQFQSQDKNKSTQSQKKQNSTQEKLDFSCFQALFSQISHKNQLKLPKFKLDFAKKTCFENKIYDNFYQSEDVMQDCSKCKKLLNMRYILKEFSQYQLFRANKIDKYMYLRNNQTQVIHQDVKDQKKSEANTQQPKKSKQIEQMAQNLDNIIQCQQNARQEINDLLQMDIEEIKNIQDINQQKQSQQITNNNLNQDYQETQNEKSNQHKLDKVEQLTQKKDKGKELKQKIQTQANSKQMEVEFCSQEESSQKKIIQKQKQEINQNQKIFQSLALQVYFNKFYTNQNDFSDQMEIERPTNKQKKSKINIYDDFKELLIKLLKNSSEQNQKCSMAKKIKFQLVFQQNKKVEKLQLFDQLKNNLKINYKRRANTLFKSYQDQNLQNELIKCLDSNDSINQNQNELSYQQNKIDLNIGKSNDIYFECLDDQRYQQKPQNKEENSQKNDPSSNLSCSLIQQLNTPSVQQQKYFKQNSVDDSQKSTSCDKKTFDKINLKNDNNNKQKNFSTKQKNENDFDKQLFDCKDKNSFKQNMRKIIKQESSSISENSINQQNILESCQIDENTTYKKQFESHDFQSDRSVYKVRNYIIDDNTLIQQQNDFCNNLKYNVYEYQAQDNILDNQNQVVQKDFNYDQYSEISFSKLSQYSKKNIFSDLVEQPQALKNQNIVFNTDKMLCTNISKYQEKQISETEVDILKTQHYQYNQIQNDTSCMYSQVNQSQCQGQKSIEFPSKKHNQEISQKFEKKDSAKRKYTNNIAIFYQNNFDDSINQDEEITRSIQIKSKICKKSLKIKNHLQNNSNNTFNLTNLQEKIKKKIASEQNDNSHLRQELGHVEKNIDKSQNRSQIQQSDQLDNNYSFQLVKFINSFKQNKCNQN